MRFTPAINDVHVAGTRRDLGLWLDTSEQTPEESVDELLQRAGEATRAVIRRRDART